MDRSTPIYLVAQAYTQDQYGVMRASETKRKVFANVTSVTGREWFDGGRNGLNPEYRMTLFSYDYNGEDILEYNGIQYSIYRTYMGKNDSLELYVQKKKGNE